MSLYSNKRHYKPLSIPQIFSDEEMVRDWTLSEIDKQEIAKYHKKSRP